MMTCPQCNGPFTRHTGTRSTCLGYFAAPPHDHDPNANARDYYCAAGHQTPFAMATRCPVVECDHRGECVSDRGSVFVESWPEPSAENDGDGLDR